MRPEPCRTIRRQPEVLQRRQRQPSLPIFGDAIDELVTPDSWRISLDWTVALLVTANPGFVRSRSGKSRTLQLIVALLGGRSSRIGGRRCDSGSDLAGGRPGRRWLLATPRHPRALGVQDGALADEGLTRVVGPETLPAGGSLRNDDLRLLIAWNACPNAKACRHIPKPFGMCLTRLGRRVGGRVNRRLPALPAQVAEQEERRSAREKEAGRSTRSDPPEGRGRG